MTAGGRIIVVGDVNPEQVLADIAKAYGELSRNPDLRVALLYGEGAHMTSGVELDKWAPIFGNGKGFEIGEGEIDPFGLTGEDLHGLKRLPLALLSARPVHLLVVMLGTNDMMTRLHRSPAEVADRIPTLRDIARQGLVPHPRVRAPGVLLVAPPPLGDTGHALFSDTFDADAQARSRALPAQLHDAAVAAGIPFLAAGQVIHTDGVDGVHLSAQAHHRLGGAVARAVQQWLLRA